MHGVWRVAVHNTYIHVHAVSYAAAGHGRARFMSCSGCECECEVYIHVMSCMEWMLVLSQSRAWVLVAVRNK